MSFLRTVNGIPSLPGPNSLCSFSWGPGFWEEWKAEPFSSAAWNPYMITLFKHTVQTRPVKLTRLQLDSHSPLMSRHRKPLISLSLFWMKAWIPHVLEHTFREREWEDYLSLLCQDTVDICCKLSHCITSCLPPRGWETVIIIHLFSPWCNQDSATPDPPLLSLSLLVSGC